MAKRLLTSAIITGLSVASLLATPAQASETTLKGAGSSFANKFLTTCAVKNADYKLSYNPAGSGTGRSSFANATVDFGASDAASAPSGWAGTRSGYTTAKYTYIPVVGGPVAILYKVPGISTGALRLDSVTLAKIYSGKITKWNDAAIKALQTSAVAAKLPSNSIRVVYRSASSGTSENFTDYLRQTAPAVWTKAKNTTIASGNPSGRMPAGSIGATNSQALVSSVKSTNYTIGYSDYSDAKSSNVAVAAIKNAKGEWIKPSSAAAAKFLGAFSSNSAMNSTTGAVTLNFKKSIAGAYNLSLLTYVLVDKAQNPSTNKAQHVEAFTKYLLNTCGPDFSEGMGYAPIEGGLKTKALALADRIAN